MTNRTLTALILAVALCGCGTLTNEQQLAGYLADARDIAEVGTTAVLIKDQNLRGELEEARDALKALEALPPDKVTVNDLLNALAKLPIDELQSPEGKIYVAGGKILVRRFLSLAVDPEISVGAGYAQKFASQMRQGMDAALGQ